MKKQPKRVYVAGPISKGDLRHNINQAREAGRQLMRAGFAPLVPHFTCYYSGDTPEIMPWGTVLSDWLGIDLPYVEVSHALLRLPGESVGADAEVAHAQKHGVPVFYSVIDLIAHFAKQEPIVDQPPPMPNGQPAVWDLVIADMHRRDLTGRQRYGTPLQPHNGRDALVDLYQELLDACAYIRQEIEERKT